MALPPYGQLSLSQIANEQQLSLYNISLRSMSSDAGFGTPDAVSDFYGWAKPSSSTYSLIMYNVMLNDPCSGTMVSIYMDDKSGEYAYSQDGANFTYIRKPIFVYASGWTDYYTGEYYYDEIMVYTYGYEYYGGTTSRCAPYSAPY
jgi:hypothetical protein